MYMHGNVYDVYMCAYKERPLDDVVCLPLLVSELSSKTGFIWEPSTPKLVK